MEILSRYRKPAGLVVANVAFAALFLAVALSAFHRPTPHALAVGVVAPASAAAALRGAVDAHAPGAFDLRPYPSAARARAAIADRRLQGAVVATPGGLRVLTAEAGGNGPAQAIAGAFGAAAAGAGRRATVVDVVPPRASDSQALSPFFLILCVLFPSLATGLAAGHAFRRSHPVARVAVPVTAAVAIGLAAAGVADGISGLGDYWAIAGIVALFSLAISAPTAALGQIAPHAAGLAVLAFLVLGIPASGGPANLAGFGSGFLRALSPVLPLGVGASAVRNTVYFGAGDTTGHLWALTAYAIGGLAVLGLLIALAHRRARRPAAVAAAA